MYSGLIPLVVYAFTGTSRQLAVGPVAMVSLIVEVMLRDQLTEDECPKPDPATLAQQWEYCPDQYAELAFLAAFLVGIFQVRAKAGRGSGRSHAREGGGGLEESAFRESGALGSSACTREEGYDAGTFASGASPGE
jgi:hypothetical protein